VVAFTICDDVTARDLALAQPGFLSQAKVYGGSFALGPCLVTPDELGDPQPLQVRCTILRGGEPMFSEAIGTAGLPRRLTELAVWLGRDNPGVPGTVVFVGAGVEIPEAQALRNGDRVDIEAQGIGRLSNPVGR
jgi:2-dehydro-3-deoxy-D-arabinonate dehydratase